jgi:hypothetical protein
MPVVRRSLWSRPKGFAQGARRRGPQETKGAGRRQIDGKMGEQVFMKAQGACVMNLGTGRMGGVSSWSVIRVAITRQMR